MKKVYKLKQVKGIENQPLITIQYMDKERTIEALNSLIIINSDRIEGYETALNLTEELDLKALFERFILTSQKCNQELKWEVKTLGGREVEVSRVSGKFFRAWMSVKTALLGKDRTVILDSCEFSEDEAQESYETVLENGSNYFSAGQDNMIKVQKSLLKADHDFILVLIEDTVEL